MQQKKQKTKCLEGVLEGTMEVWHHKDGPLYCLQDRAPGWPDNFDFVATLDTEFLDEAFEWTNTDDGWQRFEVDLFYPYGWNCGSREGTGLYFVMPRSTSVGDVFVTAEGIAYMVAPLGFKRLAD